MITVTDERSFSIKDNATSTSSCSTRIPCKSGSVKSCPPELSQQFNNGCRQLSCGNLRAHLHSQHPGDVVQLRPGWVNLAAAGLGCLASFCPIMFFFRLSHSYLLYSTLGGPDFVVISSVWPSCLRLHHLTTEATDPLHGDRHPSSS